MALRSFTMPSLMIELQPPLTEEQCRIRNRILVYAALVMCVVVVVLISVVLASVLMAEDRYELQYEVPAVHKTNDSEEQFSLVHSLVAESHVSSVTGIQLSEGDAQNQQPGFVPAGANATTQQLLIGEPEGHAQPLPLRGSYEPYTLTLGLHFGVRPEKVPEIPRTNPICVTESLQQ